MRSEPIKPRKLEPGGVGKGGENLRPFGGIIRNRCLAELTEAEHVNRRCLETEVILHKIGRIFFYVRANPVSLVVTDSLKLAD